MKKRAPTIQDVRAGLAYMVEASKDLGDGKLRILASNPETVLLMSCHGYNPSWFVQHIDWPA